MSKHDIAVTVQYLVPIDTDHFDAYPPDVWEGKTGLELAEAMARFDAEHGDEPLDVYATDLRVIETGAWST